MLIYIFWLIIIGYMIFNDDAIILIIKDNMIFDIFIGLY
jgi:hypothetical protein